jgi:antitoxin (DNA-binding transcriptional repressor) of toxin-antitoxin stability system
MTRTIELHEAQALLAELIAGLKPDEEVQITQNHKTVARIVLPKPQTPQFGRCKGMLTIVSDDDEHLKDFEEYLY